VRRVDFEIYWLPVDTLVVTSYSCRLVLDFPLDILELREPSIRDVVKFCPFWLCCYGCCCVRLWRIVIGWNVDELKNERSSSDDAATTGQEVPADYVFKD